MTASTFHLRLALVCAVSTLLSGCYTVSYHESRAVRERAKIEEVLQAEDGTTALVTRHSYYRIPFDMLKPSFFLGMDDRDWDEDARIPLRHPERIRYVVIHPAMMSILQEAERSNSPSCFFTPADPRNKRKAHVSITLRYTPLEATVIPSAYLGPDATPDDLPHSFQCKPYKTLSPDSLMTPPLDGKERQVRFSDWEIKSRRRYDPALSGLMGLPLTGSVDILVGIASAVGILVGAVLIVPCAVLLAPFTGVRGSPPATVANKNSPSPPAKDPPPTPTPADRGS